MSVAYGRCNELRIQGGWFESIQTLRGRRLESQILRMTTVFGTIAIISSIMVITEKNTIHSVFYLVMSFVNTAIILIITGVDYLGLLIIIVYVGAIAILFLFVVMMINIKSEETNRTRYTPIGLIITMVLIMEVYMVYPQIPA